MLEIYLAAAGGLALAIGLVSRPLRQVPVTEPLLGMVVGVVFGPRLLGVADVPLGVEALGVAAELSMAIALMAIALRFSLEEIRAQATGLLVLLIGVLVAMAGASTALAAALLALPLSGAWLLGAIMTPTDPVLASSVVSGEAARRQLPVRTRVLISVEAGANDALVQAFVVVGVAAVAGDSLTASALRAVLELGWGVVLGIAIGWVAGRLLLWSEEHHDIEHSAFLALTLALALFALGVVDLLGGAGLMAVFASGLAYSEVVSQSDRSEEWEVQEAMNRYLIIPVFILLGVALPWAGWGELGWRGPAFVAALLLLRRLPFVLAARPLLGVGWVEAGFIGWFGPIGVAALFYLSEAVRVGVADGAMWALGTMVIAASTLLHGITASPGRQFFARLT